MTPTATQSECAFQVAGTPQSRGSKRAFRNQFTGKIQQADSNEKSKPWMGSVAEAAREAMDGRPLLQGPVSINATLYFVRPKSHYGTGKNSTVLKASAPEWHSVKPDASKVLRAIEDAMTGVVYRDDAQVAHARVQKVYADAGASAMICVSELAPAEPAP